MIHYDVTRVDTRTHEVATYTGMSQANLASAVERTARESGYEPSIARNYGQKAAKVLPEGLPYRVKQFHFTAKVQS